MQRDVLVVGESLVDIVHAADGSTREYAGGSAANVAVALARLGRPVRFVTAWADDGAGGCSPTTSTVPACGSRPSRTRWTAPPPRRRRWRGRRGVVRVRPGVADRRVGSGSLVRARVLARGRPRARRRPGPRAGEGLRETRRSAMTSTPGRRSPAPGRGWWPRVERMAAVADLVRRRTRTWPPLPGPRPRRGRGRTCWRSARGGGGDPRRRRRDLARRGATVEVASLPVEVADTSAPGTPSAPR